MHSSISSSEPVSAQEPVGPGHAGIRRAIVALILTIACVMLSAEIVTRYAFPRMSRIELRIHSDEREVRTIPALASDSRPAILLAGNSLLLRGLDYPRVRTELAPDAHVVRYVIENTEYLDWYYGLHHLFASGIRPRMVVLCLNLGQTVSPQTLGDYSARHLFGLSELLPVAHDAGMSATQTSGLVLAHWSAFYASRATMRNFILNKSAPGYAAAMHTLADNIKSPLPPDEELLRVARARLHAIDLLCRQSGVELVLLIPPSMAGRNEILASAADLEKVSFDYPFPTGTLGAELFRPDGAHLNEQGAVQFTAALTAKLRARIAIKHAAGSTQASPEMPEPATNPNSNSP